MELKTELKSSTWAIALAQLKDAPHGTKLPFSAYFDDQGRLVPRNKYQHAFQTYKTTESFIKFGEEVYEINRGPFMDSGSFAKIKLKWDQKGTMSILKKQETRYKSDEDDFKEQVQKEYEVLKNHQLSKGMVIKKTTQKIKAYTDMTYLGLSLESLLEQSVELCDKAPVVRPCKLYLYKQGNELRAAFIDAKRFIQDVSLPKECFDDKDHAFIIQCLNYKLQELPSTHKALKEKLYKDFGFSPELDEDTRLDLAISICLELANLHEGKNALNGEGVSHGDVKPANIAIDANGAHLIDFGFSTAKPTLPLSPLSLTGSPVYMPYTDEMGRGEKITKAQADLFALKRVLFMPRHVYYSSGHTDLETSPLVEFDYKKASLLTLSMLNNYKLAPFIDTSSTWSECNYYLKDDFSVRALAAILIVAKLKLPHKYEDLIKDQALIDEITNGYEKSSLNPYRKIEDKVNPLNNNGLFSNKKTSLDTQGLSLTTKI